MAEEVVTGFRTEMFNPQVPVRIPVDGFINGTRLTIVLLPTQHPRFHVNFVSQDDIVLHFNPRFDEDTVVNNSTLRGAWQAENRLKQPLQPNRIYTVEFLSESGKIIISINGNQFCEFAERLPFQGVQQIEISSGVFVHSVLITRYAA